MEFKPEVKMRFLFQYAVNCSLSLCDRGRFGRAFADGHTRSWDPVPEMGSSALYVGHIFHQFTLQYDAAKDAGF